MSDFIPSENRTQRIIIADYYNVIDSSAIVELMDQYAQDKMGGGVSLPDSVKTALVPAMANVPGAFTVLALIEGKPAGLINCFMGFSTFKAKPLINIHDVIVLSEYRGRKLSQLMPVSYTHLTLPTTPYV